MENKTTTEALNEEQVENAVEQSVAATEVAPTTEEATAEGEGTEPVKAKKASTRKSKVSKAKAKVKAKAESTTTSVGDAAPAEVETTTKSKKELKAEAHVKRCQEIAEEYKKLYPTAKEFHITPDYQVFLGESESAAKSHATKRGGAIQTIKFD